MTILVNKENQMTKFIPFIVVLSTFATIACGSGDPAIRPDSEVYVGGASAEPDTRNTTTDLDTNTNTGEFAVGGASSEETITCESFPYTDPCNSDTKASTSDGSVSISCKDNLTYCGYNYAHPIACYDQNHILVPVEISKIKEIMGINVFLPSLLDEIKSKYTGKVNGISTPILEIFDSLFKCEMN
jgi:hypothetical protein